MRYAKLQTVLFFGCTVSVFLYLPTAAQTQGMFDNAVKAYNNHQYGQAISSFRSLLDSNPKFDLAHYYLGLSYHSSNQRNLARAEYEWLLKNGQNPSLKSYAAAALQHLGIKAIESDKVDNGSSRNSSTDKKPHGAGSPALVNNPSAFFINSSAGGGGSKDCGPACLAMIFRAYNKYPGSFKSWSPSDLIHQSRVLMTGSDVQENTTLEQVEESMAKAGYRTDRFDGVDKLDSALKEGKLVMIVGSPGRKGSYGARLGTDASEGHYVVVTGKRFGQYIINDPNFHGPVEITRDEMSSFLDFYKGQYSGCCIAISL